MRTPRGSEYPDVEETIRRIEADIEESISETLFFRFGPPWRYWAYRVGLELGRRIHLGRVP